MISIKDKEKRRAGRMRDQRNRDQVGIVRLSAQPKVAVGALADSNNEAAEQAWDDIVFENRNREYGAYVLRQGYSVNVVIGLVITIVIVAFLIFYPTLAKMFGTNQVAEAAPRKLVYSQLSLPPPIAKPKPPPPSVLLPRLQKVIKFVPPKVVKEEVSDIAPTVDEIKENDIGAEAVEGPADIIFEEPVAEVVAEDNDELFTVVDQQPEFAGGYEAMMAFIKQNLKYPPNARRMQIEGTVHLSFVVSKTGQISDVTILRGIMTECDREAVRVVQMMPAWKPGKQNGRNVNVRFILPLKFRLN